MHIIGRQSCELTYLVRGRSVRATPHFHLWPHRKAYNLEFCTCRVSVHREGLTEVRDASKRGVGIGSGQKERGQGLTYLHSGKTSLETIAACSFVFASHVEHIKCDYAQYT